jgi:quinol monooxygenase YgiN
MPHVVQLLLRITAVPGHTDDLLQALRSVMRNVQVDGACSDAHLLADLDDGNALWYWEDWTALDAFERHMRSERFARLLSIIETSSTLPLLECRVVAETRGLEYLAAVRGVQLRDDAQQPQADVNP